MRDDHECSFEQIATVLELKDSYQAVVIYDTAKLQREQSKRRKGRKLNEKQVGIIRRALTEGKHTQKQIAQWFGVSAHTIRDIADGSTWKGR
jgi:DNA-directed RNA polymerase sigma subunit (sigma70/sigma32)